MAKGQLNQKVLGQLLLMQSVLINLPDNKSIFSFVCKGFQDIPGVDRVINSADPFKMDESKEDQVSFPILMGDSYFGKLIFYLSDSTLFKPYEEYLNNFIFMLGVILEKRQQQKTIEENQLLLEKRILERTSELNLEKENLMESQRRFVDLMKNVQLLSIILDSTGEIIFCNSYLQNLTGYTENELLGKNWFDLFFPAEKVSKLKRIFLGVMKGETSPLNYENELITKQGDILIISWNHTILWDSNHQISGFASIGENITERKKTEIQLLEKNKEFETQNEEYSQINEELNQAIEELTKIKYRFEESEETYSLLFESINDAVMVSELQKDGKTGRFVQVNNIACERLGYTREELLSKTPLDISSEKAKKAVPGLITDILDRKHAIIETEHVTKEGRILPVEISTTFSRLKNKNLFYSVVRDISERKKAEQALRESEARFSKAYMTSPISFMIAGMEDGVIIEVNDAFSTISGFTREEATCRSTLSLNIWVKEEERNNMIGTLREGKPVVCRETSLRRKDGKILTTLLSAQVIQLQGKYCIISSIEDITERKQMEIELVKAKDKAEESDRLKTAFLQNMSHEIRTPMNAIMGFSELLLRNANDVSKLKKFTDIISQRSNDLLNIINEILDISKIESGQLPVNIEECDLNELFSELSQFFTEYKERIGKEQLYFKLIAECNPSDCTILTDKVKLKQIFINLLNNAFKFTDTGGITGGCKLDDTQKLVFYVTDTGIGIPFNKQKLIFERFTQLASDSTKIMSGTGLGLSIVKGLVSLLGGEINVESEVEKGTSFSFSIQYKPAVILDNQKLLIEQSSNAILENKTVLIVEDDLYNSEYLKEILSETNLNILFTESGEKALEIISTCKVDLVLMDIRLPDMNGYEVTRQIRKIKPDLKIIVQTAYAAHDERQKALDAGSNDYISKPTKQDVLLQMLYKHLT